MMRMLGMTWNKGPFINYVNRILRILAPPWGEEEGQATFWQILQAYVVNFTIPPPLPVNVVLNDPKEKQILTLMMNYKFVMIFI